VTATVDAHHTKIPEHNRPSTTNPTSDRLQLGDSEIQAGIKLRS
jgi:hypothetical protein